MRPESRFVARRVASVHCADEPNVSGEEQLQRGRLERRVRLHAWLERSRTVGGGTGERLDAEEETVS